MIVCATLQAVWKSPVGYLLWGKHCTPDPVRQLMELRTQTCTLFLQEMRALFPTGSSTKYGFWALRNTAAYLVCLNVASADGTQQIICHGADSPALSPVLSSSFYTGFSPLYSGTLSRLEMLTSLFVKMDDTFGDVAQWQSTYSDCIANPNYCQKSLFLINPRRRCS